MREGGSNKAGGALTGTHTIVGHNGGALGLSVAKLSRPKVVGDCARSAEWNIKRQREESLVRLTDTSSRRRFRYEGGSQAKFDTREGYMDYGLSQDRVVGKEQRSKKCGINLGCPLCCLRRLSIPGNDNGWIWGRIRSVCAAPHCLVELSSHAD